MKEGETRSLVFTTDRTDKNFLKNQTPGIVECSEVTEHVQESIQFLNKIKRRHNNMSGKKVTNKLNEEELKSLWTKIVKFLQDGHKTRVQMADLILPTDDRSKKALRYLDYILQRLSKASMNIIFYDRSSGTWRIRQLSSTVEKLVNEMYANRGALYVPKADRSSAPKPVHETKIHKHIVSVEGKSIVQKFTASGLRAELKIEPLVNAEVKTNVSANQLTIEVSW